MPQWLSTAWWSALGAIVLIDLVLAGDNAIVIGLAARNVPKERIGEGKRYRKGSVNATVS
jgi:predicted tellurium resistance membrane protein TerC